MHLLGRIPGAAALKMHNLAHYAPELRKRNITAMAHGSKLDAEIWKEFSSNWEELSYQARLITAYMKNGSIDSIIHEPETNMLPEGIVRE